MREIVIPMADDVPEGPPMGMKSLQYCEKSKMLVVVFKDGSCALFEASAGGLSPLVELAFSHWVCTPQMQATCARIGTIAQTVAVGFGNGDLALFRYAWGA